MTTTHKKRKLLSHIVSTPLDSCGVLRIEGYVPSAATEWAWEIRPYTSGAAETSTDTWLHFKFYENRVIINNRYFVWNRKPWTFPPPSSSTGAMTFDVHFLLYGFVVVFGGESEFTFPYRMGDLRPFGVDLEIVAPQKDERYNTDLSFQLTRTCFSRGIVTPTQRVPQPFFYDKTLLRRTFRITLHEAPDTFERLSMVREEMIRAYDGFKFVQALELFLHRKHAFVQFWKPVDDLDDTDNIIFDPCNPDHSDPILRHPLLLSRCSST